MKKIYMGIPSTGTRVDAQVYRLREIEAKTKDKFQLVYPSHCVHRISHDFARNAVVKDFLESDCDYLWFLDSDVVPHTDVLDVFEADWELAGAPYPLFLPQKGTDGPQVTFAVYKQNEAGRFYPSEVRTSGIEFVDGVATGCMFIKRAVFTELSEPYFEHKYNPVTRELVEGEDLGFCRKIAALGKKFYINYAHVCDHIKSVSLLSVNNYAVGYANAHKLHYERELDNFAAKIKLAKLQSELKSTSKSGLVLAQPTVFNKR